MSIICIKLIPQSEKPLQLLDIPKQSSKCMGRLVIDSLTVNLWNWALFFFFKLCLFISSCLNSFKGEDMPTISGTKINLIFLFFRKYKN